MWNKESEFFIFWISAILARNGPIWQQDITQDRKSFITV